MRQGGEPQGVQIVRQGEPTPYHCDFNPLYRFACCADNGSAVFSWQSAFHIDVLHCKCPT